MKQTNKDALESKISKLISKVEVAGSWKKPFKEVMTSGVPTNHSTNRSYKGINIFFLWMEAIEQRYQTNNWLTLKQCNDLNAKVNKGEKSTLVFFFKPLEVKELDEQTGELISKNIPMLKTYRVFNIDQTTLKPETTSTIQVDSIPYCEEFFNKVNLCEVKDGNRPYYALNSDYISMPNINNFIDANSYYATLGHELIHSTGHRSRLNRDMDNNKNSYAYEELIAELGSCFICANLKIDANDIQDNAAAYLKSWLKSLKDDPKYLYKAMNEAFKAYEYILKHIEDSINTNTTIAA